MTKPAQELTEIDKVLIRKSFDLKSSYRRIKTVLLFSSVLIVGLVIARYKNASADLFFWVAIIYVTITAMEKMMHGMAVLAFKRLVVKLVRAIDLK